MWHTLRMTPEKIAARLRLIAPLVYRRRLPLPPFRYRVWDADPARAPVTPDVEDDEWPLVPPHTYWGEWKRGFVLRTTFQVPADWEADSPVALFLPIGQAGDFSHPEALVFVDGVPLAACDRHHQEIRLPDRWRDGRSHLLALHGWTGLGGWHDPQPGTRLLMGAPALVLVDPPTRAFVALARVTLETALALSQDHPARDRLLDALDAAFRRLETREPLGDAFYASVPEALALLETGVAEAGSPLDVEVVAVGHAHIDVAWLWTVDQARQKARRTFSTVIHLMDQDPDFHFLQSQPQLYDFVRQDDPALFERIRQRVAEGRWEPVGGMWVEADANITGPESLVRQLVLGRRFFRQHFGPDAESPVLWLPDVFGYPASLPQLMAQAGLRYFMSIKISWNQYNRFPYDTFWWQGIDGTRVLVHFSTVPDLHAPGRRTYNATATPAEVLGAWREFRQKEVRQPLLMVYGHGDGGGGPTAEMLENVRLMSRMPGLPQVRPGRAGDFFRQVEKAAGDRLPVWNGELYLEYHRGTYTTQGRTKQANRRCEFALHDAEFLAALAALVDPTFRYPHEALEEAWRLMCLNQFHDILPGSSIGPVYEEALARYERVEAIAKNVQQQALAAIVSRLPGRLVVVNPTSFARREPVFWPEQLPPGLCLCRPDGTPVPVQVTAGGTWIDPGECPPYSLLVLDVRPGNPPPAPASVTATPTVLENDLLRVELNAAGDIVRLCDRRVGREILPPGQVANRLLAFEDRPLKWDAWDIDIFYDDKVWEAQPAESVRVVEAGPLRGVVEIRRRILNSTCVQRLVLTWNSARLDFETEIEWRERHVLLKAAFPVEVLSPAATCEIQWGSVERPTHRNTSWDWARFEVPAQKWIDLSEGDYGVSLLNNGRYGHDVRDNVMRLTLLRSPTAPDPQADQGRHQFTYSLFPHLGRVGPETVAAAYALNDPLLLFDAGEAARPRAQGPAWWGEGRPLVQVDRPNVVVETVKWADDGRGLIVRCYESQRCRGPVTLHTAFPVARAWRTNLLEENAEPLKVEGSHRVRLWVTPFQVVTLRLEPAR